MIGSGGARTSTGTAFATLMTYRIAELDRWKARWDAQESERRDAGFLAHLIHRSQNEPDLVTVLLPVADLARARAFASSPDRTAELARSGVQGRPEVHWLELLRSDLVWDRRLPAVVVTARVTDVDTWLAADDAAAGSRQAAGVVGHAVARSLDDPHLTVSFDQAEDFDALRTFLSESARTGPGAPPPADVRFHTSGWGTTYPPTTSTHTTTDAVRRRH